MVRELTNAEGQFHDTVPECYRYFGPRELHAGGDDEGLRHNSDSSCWLLLSRRSCELGPFRSKVSFSAGMCREKK